MMSKYYLLSLAIALNVLLFTSCLRSTDYDIEYSPDAQIYAISLVSNGDTANVLSGTVFTIDQITGRIFNKEPLPYLFHVDSAKVNVSSPGLYVGYAMVELTLDPDSTYSWNTKDSVDVNRLLKIKTIAEDGENFMEYDFVLNIYQDDPYIINWEIPAKEHLPVVPEIQKTIAFNNQFITYYKNGITIAASYTNDNDGTLWNTATVTGLPATIDINSLLTVENKVYVIDETGDIYESDTGFGWSKLTTDYTEKIVAVYGILPSPLNENPSILLAVEDGGIHYFASTEDFTELNIMNEMPEQLPVIDFSSKSAGDKNSFSAWHMIITDKYNDYVTRNNKIWILQYIEKSNEMSYISKNVTIHAAWNDIVFYDDKLYMLILSHEEGRNLFLTSNDFGLNWQRTGDNQLLPDDFGWRTDASVITDNNNNIWIFGGVSTSGTQIVDVWKGRLNKFWIY